MSSLLATLAIVVVPHVASPPPPPPATASQQQCLYSVKIDSRTYKCFTQEEWDKKSADEAAERAEAAKFVADHWYWLPIALLIVLIIARFRGN